MSLAVCVQFDAADSSAQHGMLFKKERKQQWEKSIGCFLLSSIGQRGTGAPTSELRRADRRFPAINSTINNKASGKGNTALGKPAASASAGSSSTSASTMHPESVSVRSAAPASTSASDAVRQTVDRHEMRRVSGLRHPGREKRHKAHVRSEQVHQCAANSRKAQELGELAKKGQRASPVSLYNFQVASGKTCAVAGGLCD